MDIEDLLTEEIVSELSDLKKVEIGTQEHKMAIDDVTKLMDRAIEIKKLNHQDRDYELKEKQYQLEVSKRTDTKELTNRDYEWKLFLAEDEKRDRFVRNCIGVATIAVPSVITIWGTLKSFEFEKEGTITTSVGRSFIARLFPKK